MSAGGSADLPPRRGGGDGPRGPGDDFDVAPDGFAPDDEYHDDEARAGTRSFSPSIRLLAAAEEALAAGRVDLAARFAERAAAEDPRAVAPRLILALCKLETGDRDGALEHAEAAVSAEPDAAHAHAIVGQVRNARGELSAAERSLLEALRLDPTEPSYWRLYADTTRLAGDLVKAEKLVRRSLAMDPESPAGKRFLSQVLAERRRFRPAAAEADAAMRLAPNDAAAHFTLGVRQYENGRPFRARALLREAARLDPTDGASAEAFRLADRACRPPGLPHYYLSRVIERLPGGFVSLWIGAIGVGALLRAAGYGEAASVFLSAYLGVCIYTWVADPLTTLWVKVFPPRY